MYVSDIDQSEIPAGKVYQLSIRHPDGATQRLDISELGSTDRRMRSLFANAGRVRRAGAGVA
jgi:hypothetical protein